LVAPLGAAVKRKPAITLFQNLRAVAAAEADIWRGSTAATRHLTPQGCRCTEKVPREVPRDTMRPTASPQMARSFGTMLPNEYHFLSHSLGVHIRLLMMMMTMI
jgi:hypothetical protein